MKLLLCTQCQQVLHSEGTKCLSCGSELNFLPDQRILSAMVPVGVASESGERLWAVTGEVRGAAPAYRRCRNQLQFEACNWVIPAASIEARGNRIRTRSL